MVLEKKYNVAIKKNAKGECEEVLKCKVVGVDEYNALAKESASLEVKAQNKALEQQKVIEQALDKVQGKIALQNYFIAKNYFDNLVDRGLVDTNDAFELMFTDFVASGIALDLKSSAIPPQYLKILERLG